MSPYRSLTKTGHHGRKARKGGAPFPFPMDLFLTGAVLGTLIGFGFGFALRTLAPPRPVSVEKTTPRADPGSASGPRTDVRRNLAELRRETEARINEELSVPQQGPSVLQLHSDDGTWRLFEDRDLEKVPETPPDAGDTAP